MPFFFIFGIIAAVIAFITKQQAAQRSSVWQDAAGELGLRAEASTWGYPSIAGNMGDFRISIDVRKSGGNNNSVRTRYRVLYPDLGIGLELRPENFLTRVGRFFGGQDLEVGDEEFDSSFIVKARDPNALRDFLTPARRVTLLRLAASYPAVRVTDSGIHLEANGASQSASTIVSIIRRLVSAARRITEEDADLDRTLQLQSDGDAGEALQQLRAAVRPHPDDVEAPIYEAEVLHTVGDTAAAREVIEQLSRRLPEDPEVAGWRHRLREQAPQPPQPPRPEPEVEPSAAAPAPPTPAVPPPARTPAPTGVTFSPSAITLASTLFGSRRMSFETDRLFAEQYAGNEVTWTGKVRRITPYERDYDFGEAPGTKAVITVASVSNDLYGQTTIDAVVQFPRDTAARLEHGAVVEFTGTLARVDSLMRNIYVTDATLG